jgi:macrolide-specific efflux system membrane fusion protein
MKEWTVSASLDDTQVGLIKKGDQAQITTDNVTGMVFGTVSSVSVLSSSSSGSATYPVEIAVTGTPSGLHDGASATVALIYKQVTNVLTVPTAAVHTTSASSYVYVSSNGKKVKQTVTLGLSSGGTTQIKSGLASGQQVYVQTVTVRRAGTSTNGTQQTQNRGNFPIGGGGGFGGGGFGGGSGGFGGGGGR